MNLVSIIRKALFPMVFITFISLMSFAGIECRWEDGKCTGHPDCCDSEPNDPEDSDDGYHDSCKDQDNGNFEGVQEILADALENCPNKSSWENEAKCFRQKVIRALIL